MKIVPIILYSGAQIIFLVKREIVAPLGRAKSHSLDDMQGGDAQPCDYISFSMERL